MQKSYTRTSHGNSQGESTTQQVHADTKSNGHNNLFSNLKNQNMLNTNQNTMMKTKTMSLLALAMFGFLTIFMVGCQKDDDNIDQQQELSQKQDLEDVSKVSLQRLAEMQYDQSLDESLYDDVEERISLLGDDEYNLFIQEWAKVEVKNAIKFETISSNEEQEVLKNTIDKLELRNQKSKEIYGKAINKISFEQQVQIVELLEPRNNEEQELSASNLNKVAFCPRYYYGYPTTNNGSGLVSCGTWTVASNLADPDCDYEFIFFPGPIVYNSSTLKTKGTTTFANIILNQGGVNGRTVGTTEFRILVGYGKIWTLYPTNGPDGFKNHFKFR